MHTDGENVEAFLTLRAHAVVEEARFRIGVHVAHNPDVHTGDAISRAKVGMEEWIVRVGLVVVDPAVDGESREVASHQHFDAVGVEDHRFLDRAALSRLADGMGRNSYADYLRRVLDEDGA